MEHPSKSDLEQRATEAMENFRQGIADPEEIKLLAYLNSVDERVLARLNKGHTKGE